MLHCQTANLIYKVRELRAQTFIVTEQVIYKLVYFKQTLSYKTYLHNASMLY